MANTVWKFPLNQEDTQTVDIPLPAQILCVQMQNGKACIWALCDPKRPLQRKTIRIYGTGYPLRVIEYRGMRTDRYISTFQNGPFVWHVFEEGY